MLLFKEWAILCLFFLYFVFSIQLTVNKCSIKEFDNDCIWTMDHWFQKLLLHQLSHNHWRLLLCFTFTKTYILPNCDKSKFWLIFYSSVSKLRRSKKSFQLTKKDFESQNFKLTNFKSVFWTDRKVLAKSRNKLGLFGCQFQALWVDLDKKSVGPKKLKIPFWATVFVKKGVHNK